MPPHRRRRIFIVASAVLAALVGVKLTSFSDAQPATTPATHPAAPRVTASDPIAAGRYLTLVGGCNDCHTPGWMQTGGEGIDPEKLLTGLPIGFRGPWGTTYGPNLRIFVSNFSEDDFVRVVRARNSRPPMPWSALHAMSDPDLRALYHYLKSLKPLGKPAPAFVPPGVEPSTPFFILDPSVTAKAYASASSQAATRPAATHP